MSPPIRLVSFTQRLQMGGAECRLLSFARAIDRDRYRHVIVTPWVPTAAEEGWFGPLRGHFAEAGVRVENLGLRWDDRPFRADPVELARKAAHVAGIVARLARFLRRERAQVLDLHVERGIAYGAVAGALARVPAVVATEYHLGMWASPRWRHVGRPIVRHLVDALVADCRLRRDQMALYFGLRPGQARCIPNGVDPPATDLERDAARARLGLPADPRVRVVGQISGVVEYKGHDILLRAAPRVLARCPGVHFLCCGYPRDRAYREHLDSLVDGLGLSERVHFVSHPGPIGDVWAAIDVHAHPSRFDSAPLTITEGMALGKPAVVTAVGGVAELVEEGESALMVPPDDPPAFAAALIRVLGDDELARRLGEGARARHARIHRPAIMAAALDQLFEELLAGPLALQGRARMGERAA